MADPVVWEVEEIPAADSLYLRVKRNLLVDGVPQTRVGWRYGESLALADLCVKYAVPAMIVPMGMQKRRRPRK